MITKSKFSNVKDDFYKKIKHGSKKNQIIPTGACVSKDFQGGSERL